MGLFKAFKEIKQTVAGDSALMEHGLLGRALVTDARLTGMAMTIGVEEYRVVEFTAQVFLDGREAYLATGKQRVPQWRLGQLVGSSLAVRVDPADPQRIALDLAAEAPVVTLARPADGGVARILASGRPAEATIVQHQPLGLRSWDGHDLQVFALVVTAPGEAPRQVQVGQPLPLDALALVFPGARVPVKLGAGPNDVAIDWDAARATV